MANMPTKHKSFRVGLNFLGVATILCTSFLASSGTVNADSSVSNESTNKPLPITSPDIDPNTYKLTWYDEFNGTSLDQSKWAYAYSSFDTAARTQMHNTDNPENVSVSDGVLHLTALYSPTRQRWNSATKQMETIPRTNTRKDKDGNVEVYPAPFTSGAINTFNDKGKVKASFKGDFYAEARIKLPMSESSWSSFWLTGTNRKDWPGNGEIDVFESKGYDPSVLQANTHTPKSEGARNSKQTQKQISNNGDTQSDFHTYGVLKTKDSVNFYYDGELKGTVLMKDIKDPNPLADPENGMTLRLSHMVGGSFLKDGTPGGRDYTDATQHIDSYRDGSRSDMLVDYVRVWQPISTEETTTTTTSTTEEPTTTSTTTTTEEPTTTSTTTTTEEPTTTSTTTTTEDT
ncbi:glycoside hydrolase family 16 protein, partial [Streptococcus parasanguinis]